MTYEDAMVYCLLLEAGITEPLDEALDRLPEVEEPLSDIVPELTTCNGDRQRQITLLREYFGKAEPENINTEAVADRVMAVFRDSYEANPDDVETITKQMERVALCSGMADEEPWRSMRIMNDLYDLYCSGADGSFERAFRDLLLRKDYLTSQPQEKPLNVPFAMNLRAVIENEKMFSHPIQYFINYRLTPIYLISTFGMIGVGAILMAMDEEKNTAAFISLLGACALITIAYVIAGYFLNKKIKEDEYSRFDFDTSEVEEKDVWEFSDGDCRLRFDRYGMAVNGELYYYNHLLKYVRTDNPLRRIAIDVVFAFDDDHFICLPLNAETLKMLECLDIRLQNQPVLDYIVSHKEKALKQIMTYGEVRRMTL